MLRTSTIPLSATYDAGIFDLDGVCYRGSAPIPHAAASVTRAKDEGLAPVFLTNNASRGPAEVAAHLQELGFPASTETVYTATMGAADLAEEKLDPGASIYVIGGPALVAELKGRGFTIADSADDRPDAVVQGLHKSVNWAMLSEGALAIRAGAVHLASNIDSTLPQERGFMLGNGSLVGAVELATGQKSIPTGKPFPGVFTKAAALVGGRNPLAVGDRLNTDIAGGVAAGMDSFHVLTGVSSEVDVALAARSQRPTYLGADLRALVEPHEAPRLDDGAWVAGQSWARVTDQIETSAPIAGCSMEVYRCVVAAAWDHADRGGDRDWLRDAIADLEVDRDR